MKINILLLLAFSPLVHSQTTTWETFVAQKALSGAEAIPERVSDLGSMSSIPIIDDKGVRFELWGYKYLDTKLVDMQILAVTEAGPYMPEIREMSISTTDPFAGYPRTRVDKSFTVNLDINGLLEDNGVNPPASQMVLLEHHADLFKPGMYGRKDQEEGLEYLESTKLISSEYIKLNDFHRFTFNKTQIHLKKLPNWETRAGEERFIVYALADGDIKQRVLAGQSVTTLPVTTGKINGIVEIPLKHPDSYREIPNFTCDLNYLYPNGGAWVEVYQGPYLDDSKRGIELNGGISQTSQFPVNNVTLKYEEFDPSHQPTTSGLYTFVLRYFTKFPGDSKDDGGTVLDHVTTSFETGISLRSMISTSE